MAKVIINVIHIANRERVNVDYKPCHRGKRVLHGTAFEGSIGNAVYFVQQLDDEEWTTEHDADNPYPNEGYIVTACVHIYHYCNGCFRHVWIDSFDDAKQFGVHIVQKIKKAATQP